jgi:hypothetical protein
VTDCIGDLSLSLSLSLSLYGQIFHVGTYSTLST